jgi:HAD superfamily hydrolase (TIGR01549 family)
MKRYSTYIFDLDGTITDTTAVWIQIFRDCLDEIGINASQFADDEIAKHTHAWSAMTALGVAEHDLPELARIAHGMANERLPKAQLFTDAYEALQAIRSTGSGLGIFSTMDRPIFEPAIAHHRLNEVVDITVSGTDVPNRKPAPDGILKVLEELNIAESEYSTVMYMGDKDTDIQAAHNAGVHAVLFYPPEHQFIYDHDKLMAHSPEAVITNWKELMETL